MPIRSSSIAIALAAFAAMVSCDSHQRSDAAVDSGRDSAVTCEAAPFTRGSDGVSDPLAVPSGEARAGRINAAALPPFTSRLEVWEGGDFVLANEHVAMVIEDAGASQLYDPWGGRPVGVARVDGGALIEPADFGEILLLLGSMTVLTQRVSVLHDGTDGQAAVVRAEGVMRPLPFFADLVTPILPGDFSSMSAAIDYELQPGSRHVDVYIELRSPEPSSVRTITTMHAFMHTPRMPPFATGVGFDAAGASVDWVGFASPRGGTAWSYETPGEMLGAGLSVSGFVSFFTRGLAAPGCGAEVRRHHARVTIGGPGVAGLVEARLLDDGAATREVSGTVSDASGNPAANVWVIASDEDGFISRTRSDGSGAYRMVLPTDGSLNLTPFRRGDASVAPVPVTADTMNLALAPGGQIHVVATSASDGTPLPVRVQLVPDSGAAPSPQSADGIPSIAAGRIQVAYPTDGDVTLRAPAGDVRVIVSRGYEYEIVSQTVTVAEGSTVPVTASMERIIDTQDVVCGDFHIHTSRSNDSPDDARDKLRAAVADGLELPVRTDHEFVASFQAIIDELGVSNFARGIGSIEMTSFEQWGHMGVFPLTPDPGAINAGAPQWQRYPTREDPTLPLETFGPRSVFEAVRARPEAPVIIINHPRGDPNYFDFAGYDPATGEPDRPDAWDEEFRLVEVFNDRDWRNRLEREVRDWLSLLDHGRRVFAVGSSDSHSMSSSPVGYPRTCVRVGTDDPTAVDGPMVRDALADGHATISGGIYVDTFIGAARSGDEVTGLGATANVRVRVQAANWVDVDAIDVVVDGVITQTIPIVPADADPTTPTIRFDEMLSVNVSEAGSYVIVAAYGDTPLDPVHAGRIPFGVTNPIFMRR